MFPIWDEGLRIEKPAIPHLYHARAFKLLGSVQ